MLSRLLIVGAFLFSTAALASGFATKDEARALAEKAAHHLEQKGIEAASEDFMTPGGEWHDRDLYVVVLDDTGIMRAHGDLPVLKGKDVSGMLDVDGKPVAASYLAVKENDWVEFKWKNPQTGSVEEKTTYVVKVGKFALGVGAYR